MVVAPNNRWCPSLDDTGEGTTTLYDLEGSEDATLTANESSTDWITDDNANGGVACIDFSGSAEYLRATLAWSDYPTSAMTVCFWYKPTTETTQGVFSVGSTPTSGTAPLYFQRQNSTTCRWLVDGASAWFASQSLTSGTWYHVAITYDGTEWEAFLDGSSVATTTDGASGSGTYTYIGSGYGGQSNMRFDDFRIFDRVLSGSELTDLAADRSEPAFGDEIAHWSPSHDVVGSAGLADLSGTNDAMAMNGGMSLVDSWVDDAAAGGIRAYQSNVQTGRYASAPMAKADYGSNLTISLWARCVGGATTRGLFSVASAYNSGAPLLLFQRDTATTCRWLINSGWNITGIAISESEHEWDHFALTWDGTTWRSYLNGTAGGTYVGGMGPEAATTTYLGAGYGGYQSCMLDDVAIWDSALSAADITTIYDTGTGRGYDYGGGDQWCGWAGHEGGFLQPSISLGRGVSRWGVIES